MLSPKIFIGPMSKNIVDCIIEKNNEYPIALIPSRRQVDFNSGYVNNWTTKSFSDYVKSKNPKVIICRDHSGPKQGASDDDGYESLKYDSLYFDMIHIDPWKACPDFQQGLDYTINMINYCLNINPNIKFEVGTEQSIKYFDERYLRILCKDLKLSLGKKFNSITHLVIQSGTALEGNNQIGSYEQDRLLNMIKVAKDYDKYSKEHNGDYIGLDVMLSKFKNGLDSINIAPEFGFIETNTILDVCDDILFEQFFDICFNSMKWVKWVNKNFDPYKNKKELIQICGHYVFSNDDFKNKILPSLDVQESILENINLKLDSLNIR
jgi:hypothetical protein